MGKDIVDIKLSSQQRQKLKDLKLYRRESYGDTIERIHEEFCKNNPKANKCKSNRRSN